MLSQLTDELESLVAAFEADDHATITFGSGPETDGESKAPSGDGAPVAQG